MEPETYQRLQSIVMDAAELATDLRAGYLREACAGDANLLAEAQRLLPMVAESAGAYSEDVVAARRSELNSIFEAASEAETSDAWIPERIGPYVIKRVIGRGGSGVVFEAEQPSPQRSVALKLLHPTLATPEAIARIAKEADVLARLQHAGIAQIFEAGTFDPGSGEQPFLVMELIDGIDLSGHAHKSHLDGRERAELLARVCDAVQHAHERGVVHRDLKPDNILVSSAGQPKLLDFGIARMMRDTPFSMEALTAEGQLLGTAAYMAPEQARGQARGQQGSIGHEADLAIDVFALGAIGFELLAERRPRQLEGLTITQMMHEVATCDIPRLRSAVPSIDVDLETIIGKACDAEPARRYPSAAALGGDLRRWLENRPIAARPPTATYLARKFVRRHRMLALGVGATVASLTLGLVVSAHLAAAARSAAAETRRRLYAAEMLVATGASMDPATRIRSARLTEHWADEPELLGWEWHLMDAVRRRGVVALDLPDYPICLDWHPDGSQVAVAMESTVGVFDSTTGARIATRSFEDRLPECSLTGVRWDDSGTRLAISGEFRVLLWEPEPGEDRGPVLWEHEAKFAPDVCWHPDGKGIYYVGHRVVGLDATTGSVIYEGTARPWGLSGNLFDSDGDRIAFASSSDQALAYAFPSLEPEVVLPDLELPVLMRVAWSGDDRWIAASGTDHTVRVIDTVENKVLFTNREHTEIVFGVDWHPDGRQLAVSAEDGTVRILDARSGNSIETYLRHETTVADVRWSPDARHLGTVATSGEALIWDADETSAFRTFFDGRLADSAQDRRLQWEPLAGRLMATKTSVATAFWPGKDTPPEALEFDGRVSLGIDRDLRATSVGAGDFRIERRSTGELVHTANMGEDPYLMHDWVPGRDVVLAGSREGLWRFEIDANGTVSVTRHGDVAGQVQHLRCDPKGERYAFVYARASVAVVDVDTGAALTTIAPGERVGLRSFCWSPDGQRIALAGSDGALRLANSFTGAIEATFLGHTNQIEGVHWHPTEPRIATGGRDRTVKLWNTETGDLTALFPCAAAVLDVHWIQGGRTLAALDVEGHVYLWDASRSLLSGAGRDDSR